MANPAQRLFRSLIRFYQVAISPLRPPSCKYFPTCSNYGLKAIEVHGALKGSLLATWRLMRCNPLSNGGVDRVPAPGRWKPLPFEPLSDEEREDMFRRLDAGKSAPNCVTEVSPQ